MKKKEENNQTNFSYDEQGEQEVSEQIMESYNSGVIEQAQNEKNGREQTS
jgi:hypothetical protein